MTINGFPIVGMSAPALLAFAVFLLMTGRLWTNAAYREKCAEAERWRTAYETEREARIESDKQTGELLEYARLSHRFIEAFCRATGTTPDRLEEVEARVLEAKEHGN